MEQTIELPDGRKLAFCEFGDHAVTPVFYFHGWPGSRLEPQAALCSSVQLPVRIISVDRPGYGASDFCPKREIRAWASDVLRLADHLKLGEFCVMGVSGGGPYALACAAALPDRVRTVVVVCGMGPVDSPEGLRDMALHNRLMLRMAPLWPGLARAVVGWALNRHRQSGNLLPAQLERRLPAADRECLGRPGLRETLATNWREALRPGVEGALYDGLLYSRPWGFRLEEIGTQVFLWHGEADIIVPPHMGRHLASLLPRCNATFLPHEGHFSLPLNNLPAILGKGLSPGG